MEEAIREVEPKESWHLDKRVPIAFILALIAQTLFFTITGTAWKVSVDSRLSSLEQSDKDKVTHENRIVVLEQQFSYIRSDLAEIKELLKRKVPSVNPDTPN